MSGQNGTPSPLPALDPSGHYRPTAEPLGKVAAPPDKESTSEFFYFWVERDKLVERTQIVATTSTLGGRLVEFIGLVEEVYRQSRQKDMGEEVDRFDASTRVSPPFESAGFTYAKVTILRTEPVCHAPPTEESTVYLGGRREAEKGYGVDRMGKPLPLGLLRNGGTGFAGPARIDLDFLLGKNGGHLNVNGIAGLGAKSSFLLHVNYLLIREAAAEAKRLPGKPDGRLQIVPIVFNVKNYDLFFIDHWAAQWEAKKTDALAEWKELGVDSPTPFVNARFFAPQLKGQETPVNVGRATNDVTPYSWGLEDVVEHRLFRFLFAEGDVNDANFGGLVSALEDRLTFESPTGPKLSTTPGTPNTFQKLLEWLKDADADDLGTHRGTLGKLTRRLRGLVLDGDGVLRRDEPRGKPLVIPECGDDPKGGVLGPIVVDLYGISSTPPLQRFVVAAVFRRVQQLRSGNTTEGLRYLITLDELNRFAPKNSSDPITEKIEEVAAEMRSQGVLLLGAQQQASLVSPRVIENAGIRAVGRSGTLELSADVWKFLGPAARSQAAQIQADEKLLVQPSFRAPMLAKIPYPPWALNKEDADRRAGGEESAGVAAPAARKSRFEKDAV